MAAIPLITVKMNVYWPCGIAGHSHHSLSESHLCRERHAASGLRFSHRVYLGIPGDMVEIHVAELRRLLAIEDAAVDVDQALHAKFFQAYKRQDPLPERTPELSALCRALLLPSKAPPPEPPLTRRDAQEGKLASGLELPPRDDDGGITEYDLLPDAD
jgi:hypothetical protein